MLYKKLEKQWMDEWEIQKLDDIVQSEMRKSFINIMSCLDRQEKKTTTTMVMAHIKCDFECDCTIDSCFLPPSPEWFRYSGTSRRNSITDYFGCLCIEKDIAYNSDEELTAYCEIKYTKLEDTILGYKKLGYKIKKFNLKSSVKEILKKFAQSIKYDNFSQHLTISLVFDKIHTLLVNLFFQQHPRKFAVYPSPPHNRKFAVWKRSPQFSVKHFEN